VENPSDYTLLLPDVTSNGQVPASFVFGEDGNLYYLLGTSLRMLALDPTESEWEAARAVTKQISEIIADTIADVRQAYEALTLRQKSLVQNYKVLVQAEADDLMQKIAALGEITQEDAERIEELMNVYHQMSKSQKDLVTNYHLLANANQQLLFAERKSPVALLNSQGQVLYFQTLEEAVSANTKGTIQLRDNVTAGTVILKSGMTLDLNGFTLTADYLVVMNGATMQDCGAECTGGGFVRINKENLALPVNNGDGIIAVWNGTDGYLLTRVTFQQMTRTAGLGAAQYIFLPRMSNAAAAALLADGGLDNGLKVKVSLTWNNGESQQFYTYSDVLVQKVFDGTNRWVFDLRISGVAGISDMVANPVVVADCGAEATFTAMQIVPGDLLGELGYGELPA
jgi:hypothetical protein